MIKGIQNCGQATFKFFERGLNHPNFFGRLISWGIFWGILGLLSAKVYQLSLKRFQKKPEKEEEPVKQVAKKNKVEVIEVKETQKKEPKKDAVKKKRPKEIDTALKVDTQKKVATLKDDSSPKTEIREQDKNADIEKDSSPTEIDNSQEIEITSGESASSASSSSSSDSEIAAEIIFNDTGEKKEKVEDKPKKKNRPWPFG